MKPSSSQASCSLGRYQDWVASAKCSLRASGRAHRGTHGLLRLFSPPSTKRTVRFLSRAANRPATTHPAEPPRKCINSVVSSSDGQSSHTARHDNVDFIWNGHDACVIADPDTILLMYSKTMQIVWTTFGIARLQEA